MTSSVSQKEKYSRVLLSTYLYFLSWFSHDNFGVGKHTISVFCHVSLLQYLWICSSCLLRYKGINSRVSLLPWEMHHSALTESLILDVILRENAKNKVPYYPRSKAFDIFFCLQRHLWAVLKEKSLKIIDYENVTRKSGFLSDASPA